MVKTVGINVLVFIGLLIVLEGFFQLRSIDLAPPGPEVIEVNSKNYIEPDPQLGFQPIPNLKVQTKKVFGDEVIYDVEYHFDENHRRIIPLKRDSSNKFIAFLGASNVFGEGLPVEHTLPYLVAEQNPNHRVYNYAFRGYGPTNIMALLDSHRLPKEIKQTEGVFLYPYMNHQARRLIGTTTFFQWAKGKHPFYSYNEEKGFKRMGTFAKNQALRVWFLKTLSQSSLFQWIDREFPNPLSPSNLKVLCEAFLYMSRKVETQFPEAQFYVVLGHKKIKAKKRIKACLESKKVRYFDISSKNGEDDRGNHHLHKLDRHSNFKANKLYSQRLTNALKGKPRASE